MTNEYRNLSNEDYWIKRSEERVDNHWKSIKSVEKELAKQYRLALDDIRMMVSDLYTLYAKESGLTYADAIKELNQAEIGDYKAKLSKLVPIIRKTNDPTLIAELEKLQKVVKLNRLQALMGQIDARLLEMGYEQQMVIEEWISGVYETNYYQSIYAVQQGVGLGVTFALLNETAIKAAITMPWSGDMFSNRIWDNRTKLVQHLRQTVIQGLIKGDSVQKMSSSLKNTMNSSYSNALRLIRTETAYVIGESTHQGYKQSGIVSQYIVIATLDKRTSPICRKQDNKVYRLEDRQVGVNASPFHPNCRTCEAPHFNTNNVKESVRIARGEDKQTYYVPADMSYKEWHDKYAS
jgi:SPP1 gp7 family putative phage head morphogenesis protein